ncbi:MAG: hypothetical protein JJV99_04930 [Colwellia sp.]|nr:hypothetical protein [Colwellia sp.]
MSLNSPQVFAQAAASQETVQKSAKQSWQDVINSQLELAKAKLSLLKAENELWLTKNKVKTELLLDESLKSLEDAWEVSDLETRVQIKKLTQKVENTKKLLMDKNDNAMLEMHSLVNSSQSILNTALAHTQEKSEDLQNQVSTRYALVVAKSYELKAIIALEIDKSPEKAHQEMIKAEHAYHQASETASKAIAKQVRQLKQQTTNIKRDILTNSSTSKADIESLISATEVQINTYKETVEQSEEVTLLRKRYAQLEAQSALLKAKLAFHSNEANDIVLSYLNESKSWYTSFKSKSSGELHDKLTQMAVNIDETKKFVHRKDKEARVKISSLLEQAAEMVKKE